MLILSCRNKNVLRSNLPADLGLYVWNLRVVQDLQGVPWSSPNTTFGTYHYRSALDIL